MVCITELKHVEVELRAPLVGGDVADAHADEYERAPAVEERADDACHPAARPIQPFNPVVRANLPPMLGREFDEQIGDRLANAIA